MYCRNTHKGGLTFRAKASTSFSGPYIRSHHLGTRAETKDLRSKHLSYVYTLRLIETISYPGKCDLIWYTRESMASFFHECILLPSYVYNMHQDWKSSRLIAVCKRTLNILHEYLSSTLTLLHCLHGTLRFYIVIWINCFMRVTSVC